MSSPQVFRMAVCLIPYAASIDFIGMMDVLSLLVQQNIDGLNQSEMFPGKLDPAVRIEPTYFSLSKDPVVVTSGPPVHADKTYDEEGLGQYDILFVPGGECKLPSRSKIDLRLCCVVNQAPCPHLRLPWPSSSRIRRLERSTLCLLVPALSCSQRPDY